MVMRLYGYKVLLFAFFIMANNAIAIERDSLKRDSLVSEEASAFDVGFADLESQLISLDSIIDIAMKNSPYMKYDSSLADAQAVDIKLAKRTFHNNISGFFNYSTGNQRFNITGAGGGNETQNNLLNGYRLGINVSIPLSEFTNRNLRIKRETAEYDAQKFKKEQTALELRTRITQEYTNLIAFQKLLKIKSSGVENARVLYQMAEKQFREGVVSLQDYASVSDMAIKSEVDYELAKASFRSSYYSFQNLVGVQLTSLMKRK